ncbi:OmpA family protein [Acinetobacter indicus]|uniref:OmpA family protein n=1 Tax=Acinetobacter indicus TaxID=756892 RepID=UPI000CEC797E|nr:OmpA family protein [Acinetobacter indicus]
MRVTKLVGILGLSVLGVGCASTGPISSNEKWHNFNSTNIVALEELTAEQSMVVFIRKPEAVKGSAVNIFVEGEYLTSLQAGGYKAIPLCAAPTNLTAAFTDINLNYPSVREQNNTFDLSQSRIHYFSVTSVENGQPILKALTAQQAQLAMKNTREQVNTLPRVEKSRGCPKVIYQQVHTSQPVIKKYTLAASALFAYSKSGISDVLPYGLEEIEKIAQEIQKNQDQIGHIAVIGYSDPVGSETFNQKLSLKRAETVRGLLVNHGLPPQNILLEGRGERELVVGDCEGRFGADKVARDQCNEPNRRVEIVTYGLKIQ